MVTAGEFQNGITIEYEERFVRLLNSSMLNREKAQRHVEQN